jgi:copper chaperone NosL
MHPLRAARRTRLGLALAATLLACASSGPKPIALGREACDYCRMVVDDPRFAGEAVTARGKVHVFDSVECLASYAAHAPTEHITLWVSDYRNPGTWLPAERAVYVRGGGRRSPMGAGLAAFVPESDAAVLRAETGGETLTWREVVALAARAGAVGGANHDDAPAR